ncbi:MAG: hypothetical protein M9883_17405 [Methylobacteriaceae bacterium]|nr:hypothetical protein [Hyphomicrobiales bacterium]MCO5088629.1 hypothetical protein [Methylobacteriaceae bacterium]
MKAAIGGAIVGVAALATAALGGPLPFAEPASKQTSGEIQLAQIKMDMKFRWTGQWVWRNGMADNTSSYEWLKSPTARYCYNRGCQTVTHASTNGVDTFSTADGGYFELKAENGGEELAGRYWRKGIAARNTAPDAIGAFISSSRKPVEPPKTGNNVRWSGYWAWSRPLLIFDKPVGKPGQQLSIELLQNSQVRLCFDLRKLSECKVTPFTSQSGLYIIQPVGGYGGYYEIKLNSDNIFGKFWWDPKKRGTTPDGTFNAVQLK